MPHPKVILVEDHHMIRQMLEHLITKDLELDLVGSYATCTEGIDGFLKFKPDLGIVDWMLPDGRGFDIVRKAGASLSKTRWLFLSSNEQGHLVREAVHLGIHGFIQKRSDIKVLRDGIRKVLVGEKYYCPESAKLLVEKMVDESQHAAMSLTGRESEILRRYAKGQNPKDIATDLDLSAKTISNNLTSIKEKLNLFEPAQLVTYAIKHGYIETP
ncbi:MAG: response regulator [Opitutales bacterium]